MKKLNLLLILNLFVSFLMAQPPAAVNQAAGRTATSNGTPSSGLNATDDPNADTYFTVNTAITLEVILDLGASCYIENMAGDDISIKSSGGNYINVYGSDGSNNYTQIASIIGNNSSPVRVGTNVCGWYRKIKISINPYMGAEKPRLYDLQVYGSFSPSISYFSRVSIGTTDNSEQLNVDGSVKAYRFIGKSNASYYLDPSNTGTSLNVAGTIKSKEIQVVELNTDIINSDEIKAKSINVEIDNVADYVFEKEYNLLPLSSVEQFIIKNKHLPEIPSASEMQTKGMDIAEMNNLLLKKIEELTLYLIEINKVNEQLIEELRNSNK
jgi:hypothetical protein